MSIRRTGLLVLVIVLLVPAGASATGHNADLSGGYSELYGSHFRGFHETFGKTLPFDRRVSILGDLSIYRGTENDSSQTLIGWMGGLGRTFGLKAGKQSLGGHESYNYAVTATPRVLLGAFHKDAGPNSRSSALSASVGGALDWVVGSHSSSEAGWGGRVAYDYIVRGDAHNLHRVSFEAVYRFGHQPPEHK